VGVLSEVGHCWLVAVMVIWKSYVRTGLDYDEMAVLHRFWQMFAESLKSNVHERNGEKKLSDMPSRSDY
jgi:hypothetical protein